MTNKVQGWKRAVALLAACMMIFVMLPVGAFAQTMEETEPFSFAVTWTDALGQPQMAQAARITYEGFEDCFWVQVPQDAALDALTLQALDLTSVYSFDLNGQVLPLVMDAGASLTNTEPVLVTGYTADLMQSIAVYLYVSTFTALPDPPQQLPAQDALVTVKYQTAEGLPVASDTYETLTDGVHEVFAWPEDLQDGYELDGSMSQTVSVQGGVASPAEVVFIYRQAAQPTPVSVQVTVRYVDELGNPLAQEQSLMLAEGANSVEALVIDGYQVMGESTHLVIVTADGASETEVVFVYQSLATQEPTAEPTIEPTEEPTEEPTMEPIVDLPTAEPTMEPTAEPETPVQAQVTVRYLDFFGAELAPAQVLFFSDGLYPVAALTFENYQLSGEEAVVVNVQGGVAQPAEVIFYYAPVQPEIPTEAPTEIPVETPVPTETVTEAPTQEPTAEPTEEPTQEPVVEPTQDPGVSPDGKEYVAEVCIRYWSEDGEIVAEDTYQKLVEGENIVSPNPQDLETNFELLEPYSVVVTVKNGVPDQDPVVFYYEYQSQPIVIFTPVPTAEPTAEPTVEPTQEPQKQYAAVTVTYLNAGDGTAVVPATTVNCEYGQTTLITPAIDAEMMNLELVSEAQVAVQVDAQGNASPQEVMFLYRLISTGEEAVQLPVWYYSKDRNVAIASPTTFACYPGENQVVPNPLDMPAGVYELADEPMKIVTLTDDGLSQDHVVFYYQVAPVQVTVKYVCDGKEIWAAQQVSCPAGSTLITPDAQGLNSDYALTGAESYDIWVDENGADPAEVTFTYTYTPSNPAPKVAFVNVNYVGADGQIFYNTVATCFENAANRVEVDWNTASVYGYAPIDLQGESAYDVTVDAEGIASPAQITFTFGHSAAEPTETPAPSVSSQIISVYYRTREGLDVASRQEFQCQVGNNLVEANPVDLKEDYVLDDESSKYAVLSEDGQLTPSEIIFYYKELPKATATPLPYEVEPMDGYGYPTSNGINFRTGPSTSDSEVLRQVDKSDLAHISGKVVNNKNEEWFLVEFEDQQGFIKGTVLRQLTEAEIAALFHYTLAPTQEPTPSPTPIPDGAAIDLWGYTNAGSVGFRKETKVTGDTLIKRIDKNTKLWVYSSETVDDTKWYNVMVGGREGFIVADYITLYSREESEKLQSQFSSPMPTQEPTASPTPEITATPEVTATPEASQNPDTPAPTAEPTATPAAYKGYALTMWQIALRTGVTEDTTLEWLPVDSLVYVSAQTYVDGEAWSSVQAMKSRNFGFVQDEALRYITADEAQPYLDQLKEPQETATATPVPTQQEGYAMTLGDGVPLRAFPDAIGEIYLLIPYGQVAIVRGQTYVNGDTWHMVQYNGQWGYVREDQMRMLSQEEAEAYLQSQQATPIPDVTPAATAEPVTSNSLSSYGHVQSNAKVNLRSEPTVESSRLRLLENNAFALVLGTVQNSEGTWYHVSQAGTEGYIRGDYFKVLTLGELTEFLQSKEYLDANSSSSTTGSSSSQIQPVEDFNKTQWTNPALNVSYEPFNPYATPTPDPEQLPTQSPTPIVTATPSPTPEIAPVGGTTPPASTTETGGGSALPWVLLGLAAVGGGGAYYAYSMHKQNERRRQAVRAQQAQRARAAQQPQMRAAHNNPAAAQQRAYGQQPSSAPFMPSSASPRPTQPTSSAQTQSQAARMTQNTNPYRPVTQRQVDAYRAAQTTSGETQKYRPIQSGTAQQTNPQATQTYQATTPSTQTQQTANTTGTQRHRRSDRYRNQD